MIPPLCMLREPGTYQQSRVGDVVVLCSLDEDETVACWSFDLASTTWSPHDRHAREPSDHPPRQVTVHRDTADVCKPDLSDCRTVPLPFAIEDEINTNATTNADRSLIAIVQGSIHVIDASGRAVSTIPGWPTDMTGDPKIAGSFQTAHFVGSAIAGYLSDTPITAEIRLFDPRTGKKIGEIGTEMDLEVAPIEIAPNQFAFAPFDSNAFVVHDVRTAKRLHRYDVSPGAKGGGYVALALSPDRKAVFEFRDRAAYRFDLSTHKTTRFPGPACK